MEFLLANNNRFDLPGTDGRFLHLATIHKSVREFMCFADKHYGKIYIEEITGGNLSFIKDDSLVESITEFLRERGVLDIGKPTLPDEQWLRRRVIYEDKPV